MENRNFDLFLERNEAVEAHFNFCNEHKINELEIEFDNKTVSIVSAINNDSEDLVRLEDGIIGVDDLMVGKFHPDNIDNTYFWKRAVEVSKSLAIAPSGDTVDNQVINANSLEHNHKVMTLEFLDLYLTTNPNAKILEIGPGLGNITEYIAEKYNGDNYQAIDIHPHFEHPRLFKSDGKSIPSDIKGKIDLVYSGNVFQHLSKNQRMGYLKDIKELLSDGGEFIVSLFVAHNDNIDAKVTLPDGEEHRIFNMFTRGHQPLCNFFGQFTEVPYLGDLKIEFNSMGFDFDVLRGVGNTVVFRLKH